MLAPAKADHGALPFYVLSSNVPGDHPPDQWADITTQQIISVSDNASDERKRKTGLFKAEVREILIAAFKGQQFVEQQKLAEKGCDRYTDDYGIDQRVINTSERIITAAREYLVFGSTNLGDLYYAPNRTALCNVIGTNLATSVMITRKWHAHERDSDPRAIRFLTQNR